MRPTGDVMIDRYVLRNGRGMQATVLTLGGIVQSLLVPDRSGALGNVVLGFDNDADYVKRNPFFGALVGRFANRISGAAFTLDGVRYEVPVNHLTNSLHGGIDGFDKRSWHVAAAGPDRLVLQLESPDGDQGYPGKLDVLVTYRVGEDNALHIDYQATTDRPTVLNLTNHTYFNLAGEGAGSIEDHVLTLFASMYTPVDRAFIPTGAIASVEGTPFDFRSPRRIGDRLRESHEQIVRAQGYDHNFVVDGEPGSLRACARVTEPSTGRAMEVLTTEPGVQFYTSNFLDGTLVGPSGRVYRQGDAFTLETQHFPDSPNQPTFPSTVLRPGETFRSTTVYRFSTTMAS